MRISKTLWLWALLVALNTGCPATGSPGGNGDDDDSGPAVDMGETDVGPDDPDGGPDDPDARPDDPDVGPDDPDVGPTDPDAGPVDPDAGPVDPDVGPVDPDVGPVDPDMALCQPSDEICNGLDDDCDGETDEALDGLPCETGEPGACNAGLTACVDGEALCNQAAEPGEEICDGLDNDCDGEVDDVEGVGGACSAGVGDCAVAGTIVCTDDGPACDAVPRAAVPELCDGADNDCNGIVDDAEGTGQPCNVGDGACAAQGSTVCSPEGIVCDAEPGLPGDEICNGADDDCDGVVDDVDGLGDPCAAGIGACATAGRFVCGPDGLACDAAPGDPRPEACNMIDDDCNGVVDDPPVCDPDPEDCAEPGDEDGNGLADCDDPVCALFPACIVPENCAQPGDEDGNGLADCDDPACVDFPACVVPEDCATPGDEDGNGLADCDDPACFDDPACQPVEDGLIPGPQQDVPVADVQARGWQQCFIGQYGNGDQNGDPALADIFAACQGEQMMLACRPTGADTLTLAGEGLRDEVILDVGAERPASHTHNGLEWYFDNQQSWGFAPGGAAVDRFSCDTLEDQPEGRLCWHTEAGTLDGGYRCGANLNLNNSAVWERIVYVRDGEQGALRLADGAGPNNGRVEIFVQGEWGTVCDDAWNQPDADVVCRQLGYPGAREAISTFGGGQGPIWLDNVACVGDEARVLDCPANAVGDHNCGHGEDAGVTCLLPGECLDNSHCAAGEACVDGGCVVAAPEVCDDGLDNDVDGLVDCDDDDCAADPACQQGAGQIGSFLVSDGPRWSDAGLQSVSCVQACAQLFGGDAATYGCSTVDGQYNGRAWLDGWGDGNTYCSDGNDGAEDFVTPEGGGDYDCGELGCSYSAYVNDHDCDRTNYCWRLGVELGANQAYGHHGTCNGYDDCGGAENCANLACTRAGEGAALSWAEGMCRELAAGAVPDIVCSLFRNQDPGDLDEGWGPPGPCEIPVVYDVVCAPAL